MKYLSLQYVRFMEVLESKELREDLINILNKVFRDINDERNNYLIKNK